MVLKEKNLARQGAIKLKKLREHLNFSTQEMASRLGVNRTTYWKNENGETFPGYQSLKRLAEDYDISMDWFIFDRGSMLFKEKERMAEIEKQPGELKKESEAEKIPAPGKEMELKPEIKELVKYMERLPLLYHEVLLGFQKFKLEHKDLMEAVME